MKDGWANFPTQRVCIQVGRGLGGVIEGPMIPEDVLTEMTELGGSTTTSPTNLRQRPRSSSVSQYRVRVTMFDPTCVMDRNAELIRTVGVGLVD